MHTITAIREARLGAHPLLDGSCEFLLWAPNARSVDVHVVEPDLLIAMESLSRGYYYVVTPNLKTGDQYFYRLDQSRDLPDPASCFQPQGVHGPSQIVNTDSFRWTDQAWEGRELPTSIFYELHVGTYTPEGTFDALIPHLPTLGDLGITVIELMPIAQFPGARNWGYDGVYEFAPQSSYGGPQSLQRFIDAAHRQNLAVVLDVVYNHLGPEGNYLNAFGPYFTDRYRTPWGQAINFDGQGSDEVRRFFIDNALYWLDDYHFDGLRLDAVHGIFDFGARHILAELKSAVADLSRRVGRKLHLIAESDLNDSRLLHDSSHGGYNLDAQWSDDFHHSVHTLLTNESRGYYSDFSGIEPLVETLQSGWYYRGQYSSFRQRSFGNSLEGLSPSRFVVCTQNHDQVGNRAGGERLSGLVDFESQKLAGGINLLSPFVPLLFMGEEYGETAPFQYFTSHGDAALVEAVRRGRRAEFAAFGWQDRVPDPQDEATFKRSHLDHALREQEPHKTLFRLYRELIRIRAQYRLGDADHNVRGLDETALLLTYRENAKELAVALQSSSQVWGGRGPDLPTNLNLADHGELHLAAHSFLVLARAQAEEAE